MTADAHLVVRGRVVDYSSGTVQTFEKVEGLENLPVLIGIVAIEEVIKGIPVTKAPGTIRVARLVPPNPSGAEFPTGEVVLFLKNYAQWRVDEGVAASTDPEDIFLYDRPNGYQAVLRNVAGVTTLFDGPPGWQEAFGPFPSELEGRMFEQLLNDLRQAAQAG